MQMFGSRLIANFEMTLPLRLGIKSLPDSKHMEKSMESAARRVPVARKGTTSKVWIGRAISAVVILFALFDGVTKVLKVPAVIQASGRLGYSANAVVAIGIVLLACTVLYAIPRTSVVGAVLLTGYLGGAVDANVHAGSPPFEMLFPVMFGILVWAGLYLRHDRLRSILSSDDGTELERS